MFTASEKVLKKNSYKDNCGGIKWRNYTVTEQREEENIQLKSARDFLLFLFFLRIEEKAKVCVNEMKKIYIIRS